MLNSNNQLADRLQGPFVNRPIKITVLTANPNSWIPFCPSVPMSNYMHIVKTISHMYVVKSYLQIRFTFNNDILDKPRYQL